MTLLGRNKLDSFIRKHSDTRRWIENWVSDVENAQWKTPQDIKKRYTTVSFLPNNIVIFNVKGNRYRLEVQAAFNTGHIIVKWIGTHAEYTNKYR